MFLLGADEATDTTMSTTSYDGCWNIVELQQLVSITVNRNIKQPLSELFKCFMLNLKWKPFESYMKRKGITINQDIQLILLEHL